MAITIFGRAARAARGRRGGADPAPAPLATPSGLRVLTLNVAHARRQARHQALLKEPTLRRNLEAIAAVLGRERSDVVALQEADGPSAWSGGFDHVETLARLAGFDHAFRGEHNPFSLGRLDLSSGTALLSRLPLEAPRSHAFQQNWRDTKGFVAATVTPDALGGAAVDVVSIHLDFLAERVRRRQIEQLVDRFTGSGRPLVVLGRLQLRAGASAGAASTCSRTSCACARSSAAARRPSPPGGRWSGSTGSWSRPSSSSRATARSTTGSPTISAWSPSCALRGAAAATGADERADAGRPAPRALIPPRALQWTPRPPGGSASATGPWASS